MDYIVQQETLMVLSNCLMLEVTREKNNLWVSLHILNIILDHGRAVRVLKFSTNSSILVSAGEDLHINITDVDAMKRKLTLTGHSDWITSLSMSSN